MKFIGVKLMKYNQNFSLLEQNYIFTKLKEKVSQLRANSKLDVIDLGIGDVKLPLFNCVVSAMKTASEELGNADTFKGYPPSEGYYFLREKIANEYKNFRADISADEVFITDGAKGQLGSITELFGANLEVLFLSPCYVAGAEANVLRGNKVTFLTASEKDGFFPSPPYGKTFDLIYICSPNNPTGETMDENLLSVWVEYALNSGSVIIFDGAYSSFISGDYPKSIFCLPNARKCAIEINSFSKSLGFTGVRCGYTIIPNELFELNKLMKRWLGCRFNGVSYVSQRGAEAIFSKSGREEVKKRINFYKTNAEILKIALKSVNLWYNNTVCSPYVFAKVPNGTTSTDFCELLLEKTQVVATPGNGFGLGGEGYFRLSALATRDEVLKASDRISSFKF